MPAEQPSTVSDMKASAAGLLPATSCRCTWHQAESRFCQASGPLPENTLSRPFPSLPLPPPALLMLLDLGTNVCQKGGRSLPKSWARFPSLGKRGGFVWSPPAVEVGGLLPVELAVHSATVFRGSEPLEPVVDELCVLFVEVLVGHHVGGAGIDFVAAHLMQEGVAGKADRGGRQKKAQHQPPGGGRASEGETAGCSSLPTCCSGLALGPSHTAIWLWTTNLSGNAKQDPLACAAPTPPQCCLWLPGATYRM